MASNADPSGAGERIGAYRVVRRLATGGTSDVLLAKAEGPHGFERTVVLKVLLSHFGKDDEVSRMFAREASAYARLSHPSIVRLFDFFAVPGADAKKGGQLVMVLEHVDGPPLARLKSMVKAIGKDLDDKASIYVATCIFDALAAAHSAVDDNQIPAPVIHRDVNPSNVLVPWDGYPKLADFGVAKVTGLGHHSVVGMIKGTYGYMAPEQVTGNEAVTPRSDVYAAGIILWELLCRRRAFTRGALPEIEALRAMAEPRLPALESIRSDVDRTVREALRRALEPRASSRKITAEEMVSTLTAVVPLEQGRERLMSILGLVRNDARAANAQASMMPPSMGAPDAPRSEPLLPDIVIPGAPKIADFGPVTMHGVAPPPTQQGVGLVPPTAVPSPSRLLSKVTPPRPSSARMQAVKATTATTPEPPAAGISSGKLMNEPQVPSSAKMQAGIAASSAKMPAGVATDGIRELLAMPTRPAMPAVIPPTPTAVSPPLAPPPQPVRVASRPGMAAARPGSEAPPRNSSAAARLASMPDEAGWGDVLPPPMRPINILDVLDESADERVSRAPDSPRVAAPLKDLTGGLGLRDAIDEIMRGVPGSQANIAAAAAAAASAADSADSDRPQQMRETTRVPSGLHSTLIGLIPPAPAPMNASVFPPEADTKPKDAAARALAATAPPPQDFPNAGDDEPVETVVHAEPIPPATPRAMRAAKPHVQTLAMEARPPIPSNQAAQASNPATATGPMPKYLPPVVIEQSAAPHSPPPPAALPHDYHAATQPPRMQQPAKRGPGVGTVAIALVAVIALGIAGTVAFVRYQATKDGTLPPPTSVRPTASVVPVVPVVPSVSVVPVPVSVPADAGTSVAAVVDAGAAPATTTADAAATEPLAEGMGLVKTVGAAPGRRIFIDDKVVGQTPESVPVKCGEHAIKLGSTGKVQTLAVPCNGEVVVGDIK